FVSFGGNARLARGIRVGGGIDTGRSQRNTCFVVDSPQQLKYCNQVNPFGKQLDVRANATYPLPFPGQWTLSAIYQDTPGPQILASYAANSIDANTSVQPL